MAKRSDMREEILNTVERLIATVGVNNFSLRDICDALDISTGSLYYHFKTKDAIILAIIEKHFEALENEYMSWLMRHKERGDITKERFLDVLMYKGTELFNGYKMHIYLINECMRANSEIKNRYVSMLDKWYEKFVDGVRQVYGDREDARAIAYLLMLIIEGLTIRSALGDRMNDEEQELKALLERI